MQVSCARSIRICLLINVGALVVNFVLFIVRFEDSKTSKMTRFFAGEAVTRGSRQLLLSTFSTLVDALDAANVTYFMYGGTLIG